MFSKLALIGPLLISTLSAAPNPVPSTPASGEPDEGYCYLKAPNGGDVPGGYCLLGPSGHQIHYLCDGDYPCTSDGAYCHVNTVISKVICD